MNTFIKIPVNDPYFKALKDAVDDWERPTDLLANLIEWEYDRAQAISYIHSDKGCICSKEADPAELLRQLREYFSPTYEYRANRMWQMRAMSAILAAANNFVDWIRDWSTDDSQPYTETELKNAAFAFMVEKGMYDEFEQFLLNFESQAGAAPQPAPVPSEAPPMSDVMQAINNQMDAICEHGKMIDAALTQIEREELNKYREQARAAMESVKKN